MSTLYLSPLEPENERSLVASRPAFGRAGMSIPKRVLEAAQAYSRGEISKAEADQRIGKVNQEIRARAIPQETRKPPAKVKPSPKAQPSTTTDPARKRALEGAAARLNKYAGTVGVTDPARTELEAQLTGIARKNAELLAKLKR